MHVTHDHLFFSMPLYCGATTVWFEIQCMPDLLLAANYRAQKPRMPVYLKIEKVPDTHQRFVKHIEAEIKAYLRDAKHTFNLSMSIEGTPFQKKVWQAMQDIPAGHTRTYGSVAKQLETSPRALGRACGSNPLPLFIPCHRIVAQYGLGGFAHQREGQMLTVKKFLLTHEGVFL